ncbi:MAG: phage tail protein [Stellaceae bacterium]
MAAMFGSSPKTNAQASPKYTQMNVQTSVFGLPIPIVYGTSRVSNNLGWYANFQSHDHAAASSSGGGKGGGGGCFAPETPISTPAGSVPLGLMRVGDPVWCLDPATGRKIVGRVTQVFKHDVANDSHDKMLRIYFREGAIHVTEGHYLWIDGVKKIPAIERKIGDELILEDVVRTAIELIEKAPDIPFTYNLTVEPHHNFFAGGVLAHNSFGGGSNKGGTTTYSADVLCLICEGEIDGIPYSWASQTPYAGDQGFTVSTGSIAPAPWPYLSDNYPSQAIGYSGTVYAACASFDLGSSASLPSLDWEVRGIFYATAPSTYGGAHDSSGGGPWTTVGGDADPSLVVPDLLTNSQYGLGFPSNRIGQIASNDEPHAVPASGPYTITVTNHAGFLFNVNVVDTIVDGLGTNLYTCVAGTPGPYEYNFNPATGVYTFNAAQAGETVNIRYASLGTLAVYQAWCLAMGLWISPVYDSQTSAQQMLDDIATATYSEFIWSSGVMTLVPRGNQSITANGYTYTAPSTPLFDLDEDDFLPNTNPTGTVSAAANDDPVIVTRSRKSDQLNDIKIEALDRANQYAPTIVEATDQALIDQFGRRASPSKSLHMFCDVGAANVSANLQLQDQNILNRPSWTLDVRYCVLDPMDLVTLTDTKYPGMTGWPVRILQITENDDGTLSMNGEEWLGHIGAKAANTLNTGSGFTPNFNVDPGPINAPIIASLPALLAANQSLAVGVAVSGSNPSTFGGCQVWIASSASGPFTRLLPDLTQSARMGVTTADFPVGSDPDTTHSLAVDLTQSAGELESGTQPDADADNTLCLVRGTNGDELVSYETAQLTATYKYSLQTYLRRGQYGTSIVDHPSGSPFARIDGAIYQIPFQPAQIGQTFYLKFAAFNTYGGGLEAISGLTAYSLTVPAPPAPANVTGFGAQQNGNVAAFAWDKVEDFALKGYDIGFAPVGTVDWSLFKMLTEAAAGTEMTNAEVTPGTWTFGIRARDIADQLSPAITTIDLTVTSSNPIIHDAAENPAWTGTLNDFVLHYTGVLVPENLYTPQHYGDGTDNGYTDFDNFVNDPVSDADYTTAAIDTGLDDDMRAFAQYQLMLGPAQTGNPTAQLSIDTWLTGQTDPGTFVNWTIGYVEMRYLREKLSYAPVAGSVAYLTSFTPEVDKAPQIENGDSAAVAAGGTTFTFPTPFHFPPAITVTPIGSTAQYATAVNVTATQVTFHVWDSAGVDVGGQINYTASGE